MSSHQEGSAPAPHGLPQIQWLPWGPAAFLRAREEGKPVLLSIGAMWCYWCHVMDESTYADPGVAGYVNQHFVAVRADNDHRPDVNSRYNVGGWPSTVFLTGHGGYIAGATYLPADQLLAMLMEVQRAYSQQKVSIYDQANQIMRRRREEAAKISAGGEVDQRLVDRITRRAAGTYDPQFGGFGEEPKFPGISILQLLLHQFRVTREEFYRVMLQKTLDAMTRGRLLDQVEGGFFRYSPRDDWSEAQHEKMLEDNLGLARVCLDASYLLDNPDYRRVASQTIDYLLTCLYDEKAGGFRGSQGAHSEYFGLSAEDRSRHTPPPVDGYCYAGWSAQGASLLLEASWKLARADLASPALRVLDTLDAMEQEGRLAHVYDAAGPLSGSAGHLLTDRAHLLNALLDAYAWEAGGNRYLERAKEVARGLLDRFYDESGGGFFDIEKDAKAPGYLQVREKLLPENTAVVQGLLKLHQATGDDSYREAARRTLSAFVEANRIYGEFASGYAVAIDQFLHKPVEITVEGNPDSADTRAMLHAAINAPYPHLIIKPAGGDADAPARAHICVDTVCLPPVGDPAELAGAVQDAVSPRESPFQNIFGSFI